MRKIQNKFQHIINILIQIFEGENHFTVYNSFGNLYLWITEEAYTQIERLNKFGIRHNHCYILGIGGKGKGIENAVDTAKFINTTKPSTIWYGSLGIFEGSELPYDVANNIFIPASEREILEEEMKVLELIELENVRFNGMHPTNIVSVHGILPQYKKLMIQEIQDFIKYSNDDFLNASMPRQAE